MKLNSCTKNKFEQAIFQILYGMATKPYSDYIKKWDDMPDERDKHELETNVGNLYDIIPDNFTILNLDRMFKARNAFNPGNNMTFFVDFKEDADKMMKFLLLDCPNGIEYPKDETVIPAVFRWTPYGSNSSIDGYVRFILTYDKDMNIHQSYVNTEI